MATKPKPQHPVVHPLDRLPDGDLGGVRPKIKSRGDLSLAIQHIAWIRSRRQTLQTSLEQRIKLLREQTSGDMQIPVGKTLVTFDMREATLEEAAQKYVLAHRQDVFPEGTKTAKFPSGIVTLREIAPSLKFDTDVTAKSVEGQLKAEKGLMAKSIAWLKRQGVLPWLKVTITLDVAGIGRAMRAGEITDEQLAELGMRWTGGEKFAIDTPDYTAAADSPVEEIVSDKRLRRASA